MTTNSNMYRPSDYKRFLLDLSDDIGNDDLRKLKYLLRGIIGEAFLEDCSEPIELLQQLEKQGVISEFNLLPLALLFQDIKNIRLKERVLEYGKWLTIIRRIIIIRVRRNTSSDTYPNSDLTLILSLVMCPVSLSGKP